MNLRLNAIDGKPCLQLFASLAPHWIDVENVFRISLSQRQEDIGVNDMGVVVFSYLLSAFVVLVESWQFGKKYSRLQFIEA